MSETLNAQDIAKKLQEQLTSLSATVDTHEVSTVDEVGDGIARVSGLKSAMAGELLEFKSSDTGETVFGLAQNLDRDEVGAVLFGAVDSIKEGDECRTTGRIMDIPVSRAMLGRVVNPLGQPIDGLGDIVATHRRPIEFKAPGVIDRTPVCEPVQTGLLAIDSMVPIGRGQRELIIGDRKTGKTAIAIDAILNQRGKGMVCIYVAIGQKASTVANIRETLAQHGALDYTIIVSATAADSAPMQYIAPMAGAAIGEFFMYNGEDGKPASETNPGGHVLVIYDDLSKQAVAYRQMSLTLHRPPGREAYPGDIFYLHSRLLERAVKMSKKNGYGSMTASDHRDPGRRRLGLHSDQRHFHYRWSDLPAVRALLPGPAPGSRRGHFRVPRWWRRADQGYEAGRRQPPSGPRFVPGARRLYAVRLRPRRGYSEAADPWCPHDRAPEAAALQAV